MTDVLVPVILCGGAGSRLWPASRETYPKQLFAFGGGHSLFQQTLARVVGEAFGPPVIVTGNEYRFQVAEQVRLLTDKSEIVLEPMRRDSCAAIAAAAARAVRRDPKAIMLVLAADHVVPDTEAFRSQVGRGIPAARDGWIVTFGIKPTHAATAYGYIHPGKPLDGMPGVQAVEGFVEKPDKATAEGYVADGYLWNSGDFLLRADVFLDQLRQLAPDIHGPVLEAVDKAEADLDFLRLDADAFGRARATSVDYAVMQQAEKLAVVPSDYDWADVGSWAAVWTLADKDADGNAAEGDAVFENAAGCYVHSPGTLTTVVGLKDVVVVTTRDAVLVASKSDSESIKALVARLSAAGRPETVEHLRNFRPWGDYERIDRGNRYQVKRITVKPKGKLSLQSHFHRAEHWIVVTGTARVTVGEAVHLLGENESIHIPLGTVHRLENPGTVPLELIEVQSGTYLGEDDIVRYEDIYNRDKY